MHTPAFGVRVCVCRVAHTAHGVADEWMHFACRDGTFEKPEENITLDAINTSGDAGLRRLIAAGLEERKSCRPAIAPVSASAAASLAGKRAQTSPAISERPNKAARATPQQGSPTISRLPPAVDSDLDEEAYVPPPN